MGLLDDILASYNAGYPSPLNNPSPTGIAYPGQFNLPGFLNSAQFGANAQPFMPAPAGPPPVVAAAPAPTAPQSVTFPSPLNQPDPSAANAAAYGSMGVDPGSMPQRSPFDVAQAPLPSSAPAQPPRFGANAAPFSFAGPGSMNVAAADIAQPAPAVPVPMPQPRPAAADAPPAVAAASPTDVSSVNRPVNPALINRVSAADAPQAAPQAAAPTPAPFSLGGAGDRLSLATKGFIGNLHNGPIGALAGGLGALVTGSPTDEGSIATQQGTATARALLAKGASVEDVQAAVHNPVLMKSLIDSYYGKDKFKVVQTGETDNGKTFKVFNETDGTFKDVPGVPSDGSERGGTVMGPNGKPITIPPGVNRKEFIKKVSEATADAATGKMTEAQAKASSYASRMEKAQADLATLQNEGLSATQAVTSSLPGVGNYLQTDNHQRFETAKSAFITALLRQESGAAINKNEFTRYEKELFPQPGDSPQTVQQKAQLRSGALDQMRRAAGPGYQSAPAPAANGLPSGWSVQVH